MTSLIVDHQADRTIRFSRSDGFKPTYKEAELGKPDGYRLEWNGALKEVIGVPDIKVIMSRIVRWGDDEYMHYNGRTYKYNKWVGSFEQTKDSSILALVYGALGI